MTAAAIVAVFVGGPADGESHVLSHADTEWRFVDLPAGETTVTASSPREVYLRDEVVGVDGDGRKVWRYLYVERRVLS